MAFGKASCKANLEALCKILYESLFEFILSKIQAGL
jgi:myosin heavy subunit